MLSKEGKERRLGLEKEVKMWNKRLKKQISSDDAFSGTGGADSDGVCGEELQKALEAEFNKLFVNIEDD